MSVGPIVERVVVELVPDEGYLLRVTTIIGLHERGYFSTVAQAFEEAADWVEGIEAAVLTREHRGEL